MEQNRVKIRHSLIMRTLEKQGLVTGSELCSMTGCSETTIRNDLAALERQGLLRRTFGGAIQNESYSNSQLDIRVREQTFMDEKRAIARYIVKNLIQPNMTVVLDCGSSCEVLAQELVAQKIPLAVMTTSFRAAVVLSAAAENIDLYVFGGNYDPVLGGLYDEYQPQFFQKMRADVFFMGGDAIDSGLGITIRGFVETSVKRGMIDMAAKTYLLADSSKFGRNAMKFVCRATDIAGIVTDSGVDANVLHSLCDNGVNVLVAK